MSQPSPVDSSTTPAKTQPACKHAGAACVPPTRTGLDGLVARLLPARIAAMNCGHSPGSWVALLVLSLAMTAASLRLVGLVTDAAMDFSLPRLVLYFFTSKLALLCSVAMVVVCLERLTRLVVQSGALGDRPRRSMANIYMAPPRQGLMKKLAVTALAAGVGFTALGWVPMSWL